MTGLSDGARAHVDMLTRAWLGREGPRLPDDLARRLLRIEEHEHAHRDQWGNWEFAFCETYRAGRLWEPDVDRWLAEHRGGDGPLWPGNRPFAVCLSHDVDLISESVTPRQAFRSMRLSLLGTGASRRERVLRVARPGVRAARALHHGFSPAPAADALERCVEIEREHGVPATYFFTVYPGGDGHRYDCTYALDDSCRFGGVRVTVADVVRALSREGFEVGLHGSFNSALAQERMSAEKHALETALGSSVTSIRQHFLHWDARVTPRIQSRAGFSADSTLGFNRNIGFRSGTSLPFRWFDPGREESLDLIELPMLMGDVALFRRDALELDLELARRTLLALLDRVAGLGGVATLVFHPNNVTDPEYCSLFRQAIEYGLERGAWFTTVRDLDRWFRGREA